MSQVYTLPIEQAAEKLGLGLTVFKRYCRRYDVGRWPYRKLISIEKLLSTLTEDTSVDPIEAEVRHNLIPQPSGWLECCE